MRNEGICGDIDGDYQQPAHLARFLYIYIESGLTSTRVKHSYTDRVPDSDNMHVSAPLRRISESRAALVTYVQFVEARLQV